MKPDICLPSSMCAMQWFTPTKGISNRSAIVRAAVAVTRRQGPRPGPLENAINPMSLLFKLLFSNVSRNVAAKTFV